jgi:thiol-disulfide isomerase/thioredoxin
MSRYEPFTQAAYEQAFADGSPIYLFFYASWCPYCKAQEPINQAVFATNTFTRPVRGFRVNYNDSDTDADEKALARTFGVTYQHTGIFLDTDGKERKRVIGTQTEIQLREILNMIAP